MRPLVAGASVGGGPLPDRLISIPRQLHPRHAVVLWLSLGEKLPWQVTRSPGEERGEGRRNAKETCQLTAPERQGDWGGEPTDKGIKLNLLNLILTGEHFGAQLISSQNSQVGVVLRKAAWLGEEGFQDPSC